MPCKVGNVPCFLSVKNHVACSTLLKNQSEPIRKKGARIKFIIGLLLSTVFFSVPGLDTENTSILQKDAPVRKFSHNSSLPFDKDGR